MAMRKAQYRFDVDRSEFGGALENRDILACSNRAQAGRTSSLASRGRAPRRTGWIACRHDHQRIAR